MILVGLFIIIQKLVLINVNLNILIYITILKLKIEIIVFNVMINKFLQ